MGICVCIVGLYFLSVGIAFFIDKRRANAEPTPADDDEGVVYER